MADQKSPDRRRGPVIPFAKVPNGPTLWATSREAARAAAIHFLQAAEHLAERDEQAAKSDSAIGAEGE